MALDFYEEMVAIEVGRKVTQIALTDLNAEDKQKIATQKAQTANRARATFRL